MRWRVRKLGARRRAKKQWHYWFAWCPVRVPSKGKNSGMTRVWWEPIERRGYEPGYVNYEDGMQFEYRWPK